MSHRNQRTFHRGLFAGMLETCTLYKRGDDQNEGQVTTYTVFQCLLPGNEVEGRFVSASKAVYCGEAIELTTFSGTKLYCTVNHPILTSHGFVQAGYLKPGTDLLGDKGSVGKSTDVQNRPSLIEDVFQSFTKERHSFISRVPSLFDFHGDGKSFQGKIDIVRPNGILLQNRVSHSGKNTSDFSFNRANSSLISEMPLGTLEERFGSAGVMESLQSTEFFSRRRLAPFCYLCLTSRTKRNSQLSQEVLEGRATNSTVNTKSTQRFSREISRDDFFFRKRRQDSPKKYIGLGSGSCFDACRSDPIVEGVVVDPDFASHLRNRFPGQITLDKVLKVHRFHYNGPVYELETPVGYYTASAKGVKIFVSNCRRSLITKGGEPIAGDMQDAHRCIWHFARIELDRIGIAYLDPADRILDQQGRMWQPEATTEITDKLWELHVDVQTLRIH